MAEPIGDCNIGKEVFVGPRKFEFAQVEAGVLILQFRGHPRRCADLFAKLLYRRQALRIIKLLRGKGNAFLNLNNKAVYIMDQCIFGGYTAHIRLFKFAYVARQAVHFRNQAALTRLNNSRFIAQLLQELTRGDDLIVTLAQLAFHAVQLTHLPIKSSTGGIQLGHYIIKFRLLLVNILD